MRLSRRSLVAAMAATSLTTSTGLAFAQDAGRPIRLLVPLPPGSGGDNIARILATPLRDLLGHPIVVENRPGGDMMIGASQAAKAPADGNTLLMAHMSTMVMNPFAYSNISYDPVKDFSPIGKISESTAVVVVHPAVPARTLGEFVAYVKERPGQVSYGTAILMVQIAGEQLVHTRQLQMTRVPYKGGAQVMQDTLARHIDMSIADTSSYLALIKAGKLRPLITTGAERNPLLPDVPTAREAGFAEMEMRGWWGLFAPAQTSKEVVNRTAAALQKVLALPEVVQQLRAIGAEPRPLPPEAFAQEMKQQQDHWGHVIKTLKIKASE
ncbi:MAG: tripartite tricarboxylate transporter substrate binding protein [Hydrogenophaga sp.]|uniref:Bug family tripartite tricarboxylate transporter substrate binding protein n=1 Tax=Hydrogenophaga sp. TaxID=1904254 RepID=UPI0025C289B2|nr:tripartite tricarboxylate transporter substrate binding protein [Hydrogenophaga sp.]MBU7575185.1 tripartite tricarboxylate transporter substrate binding protein [Hydrogenophaga sp.]